MATSHPVRSFVLLAAGACAGLAATVTLSCGSSSQVLAHWDQPAGALYGSFEPYTLLLVEGPLDWSHVPFGEPRLYELRVARHAAGRPADAASAHYARVMTLPVRRAEVAAYAQGLNVQWTAGGVQVTEPAGVVTFIPSRSFTGGR